VAGKWIILIVLQRALSLDFSGLFMWELIWATSIRHSEINGVQSAGPFEGFGQEVAKLKNI
jgi:hypothetical protein